MDQIPESIIEQAALATIKEEYQAIELIQTVIKIAILFGQEFKC